MTASIVVGFLLLLQTAAPVSLVQKNISGPTIQQNGIKEKDASVPSLNHQQRHPSPTKPTNIPHCDPMFVDNKCRALLHDIPKTHALPYSTTLSRPQLTIVYKSKFHAGFFLSERFSTSHNFGTGREKP